MVVWDDYDPETPDHNRRSTITEDEAINRAKQAAATRGYTYKTDQEALDDFLVIHWAWIEKDE